MATETATKAPKTPKKKSNRLVIVFEGRFAGLLEKIEAQAQMDDRDADTTVLRIVEAAFATPTS